MAKTQTENTTLPATAAFLQTTGDTLPAHLQSATGAGNENVSAEDTALSRLDLIQQLSPQLDEDSGEYIEGAKLGHIFDSVTGEVYEQCFVINLYFDKKYQVFRKRKLGGGFVGSFDTKEEAQAALAEQNLPPEEYDTVETDIHACLLLDEHGKPKKPVILYMSSSKQKVSRAWNTMLTQTYGKLDRFGTVWSLTSVKEKNRQGQPYQNFRVEFAGYPDEELYNAAKEVYMALRGNRKQ